MFDDTPNCSHCRFSQWYEIKGSNVLNKRKALRCNLTRHEATAPCERFEREDLRRNLNPGTAIIYDGVEYSSLN